MFGLIHPLDHQVRSEHPVSLDEAIRRAVNFECKQSARLPLAQLAAQRNLISSQVNYMASQPSPQQQLQQQMMQYSSLQDQNQSRTNIFLTASSSTCNYCGRHAHTEERCRKKLKCTYFDRIEHSSNHCFQFIYYVKTGRHKNQKEKNFTDYNNTGQNGNKNGKEVQASSSAQGNARNNGDYFSRNNDVRQQNNTVQNSEA